MKVAYSPLFEKPSRPFSLFLFYLALCFALLAIDSRLNYLQGLRTYLKNTLFPFQLVLINAQEGIGNIFTGVFKSFTLYQKILEAQKDNELLHREVEDLRGLELENKSLRTLLNIPDRQSREWIIAEVVARQYDDHAQKILLSKGELEGLRLGLPVQAEGGLLGQISNVYPDYSEVTQITHLGMSVPAKIKGTAIHGVVYGTGEGLVDFRHFPQRYTINIGDELITSGLDGLFIPNVPIAKVVSITAASESSGVRVLADPIVSFSNIKFVMVSIVNQMYGQWLETLREQSKSKASLNHRFKRAYAEPPPIKSSASISIPSTP